jgi:peptidoglycan-associated lipoprotein
MFNRSLLLCRLVLIVLLAFSFAACSSCKKAPYKAPTGVQPLGGDIDPATGLPRGSAGNLSEVRPLGGSGEVSPDLQVIPFDYDSYSLSADALRLCETNAQWIKSHPNVQQVQIEGHCDSRGSVEYNVNLGQKRASAVREQLARSGVDPNRMTTISYGKERPLDPSENEAAWRKNRRVQFLVF